MKQVIIFFGNLTAGKKLLLLITPVLTILLSMKTALLGLAFLIFIDLITGIRRNMHEWKIPFNPFKKLFWKSIKSYLLRKTWRKTYEYGLGIIVIVVFETLIFGRTSISLSDKTFTISELAILLPAIIELWSIFENFEAVSGTNILKRIKLLLPPFLANLFPKKKEEKEDYEI